MTRQNTFFAFCAHPLEGPQAPAFIYGDVAVRRHVRLKTRLILSEEEAREWAEKKLSADEYCKIFGEPEEG